MNRSASVATIAKGGRVLVADDVMANQILALKFLEMLGYEAEAVLNGVQVLAKLKEKEFDLILMDCQMPEMDGFEATRIIREGEQTSGKHIPIIALTANAMSGDDRKCLEAGMDDYLSKPVKKDALEKMLAKWLGSISAGKSA